MSERIDYSICTVAPYDSSVSSYYATHTPDFQRLSSKRQGRENSGAAAGLRCEAVKVSHDADPSSRSHCQPMS